MVEVTARIFAGIATEDGGLDLVYTVTPTSLINGFAAGFLIGFLTVALTSIRISRINIIAAIQDLPAEAGRPLKWRWVLASTLAAAGFGAAAVVAIAGSQGVGTYLYRPWPWSPSARCWSACCRGGPCTPGRRWPCSAGGWPPTRSGPRCSTTAPPPPSSSSAWC